MLGLGVLGTGAYFFLHRRWSTAPSEPTPGPGASASPTPSAGPTRGPIVVEATPTPAASRTPGTSPRATAPPTAGPGETGDANDVVTPRFNVDPRNPENQQTRAAVLARIDQMPVPARTKEELRTALDRARGLGKIITINFGPSRAELTPADVAKLKQALAQPEVKKIIDDPSAVFVVLGYADATGNAQLNKEVSDRRAQNTISVLKGACGVQNTINSVGMGSSSLFDKNNTSRNRAVEVWAVLP